MNNRNQDIDSFEDLKSLKSGPQEEGLKINGLEQVIEMLKYADPSFRASLIKRLHARDPRLAQNLLRIIR